MRSRPWPSVGRRTVGPVAGVLIALTAAGTAIATNFGSNTASYQTPAHACDSHVESQCIANNGLHTYYLGNVEPQPSGRDA